MDSGAHGEEYVRRKRSEKCPDLNQDKMYQQTLSGLWGLRQNSLQISITDLQDEAEQWEADLR